MGQLLGGRDSFLDLTGSANSVLLAHFPSWWVWLPPTQELYTSFRALLDYCPRVKKSTVPVYNGTKLQELKNSIHSQK